MRLIMSHTYEMTADQKTTLENFQEWLSKVKSEKIEDGILVYEATQDLEANLLPLLKGLGLDVWIEYIQYKDS